MLFQEIKEKALCWFIAFATVEEIDELNILQATLLAMQRAVNGLAIQPEQVLVDGNQLPKLLMHGQAIITGDSKVQAISAASILAKVERDRLMVNLDKEYPQFTFGQHKGYGTKQHLNEIETFGVLPIHRKSFKPIKTMLIHL